MAIYCTYFPLTQSNFSILITTKCKMYKTLHDMFYHKPFCLNLLEAINCNMVALHIKYLQTV